MIVFLTKSAYICLQIESSYPLLKCCLGVTSFRFSSLKLNFSFSITIIIIVSLIFPIGFISRAATLPSTSRRLPLIFAVRPPLFLLNCLHAGYDCASLSLQPTSSQQQASEEATEEWKMLRQVLSVC